MKNRYYFGLCLVLLLAVANSGCVGITTAVGTDQSLVADVRRVNVGLTVSASNPNFGTVGVGSNSVLSVTLTNSGTSTITISNTSVYGPGFNAAGIAAGIQLNPGQDAILRITFAPAATGAVSGNVTITSNAINSPVEISLSGTGVQSTESQDCSNTISSISITPDNTTIVPGSQVQFSAIDDFGNDVTSFVVWDSSDTSIATITADGLATGIASGSVTITATK
jgi:hypothetical protein